MKKSRFTETQIVGILKGLRWQTYCARMALAVPLFIPKGISFGHYGDPDMGS